MITNSGPAYTTCVEDFVEQGKVSDKMSYARYSIFTNCLDNPSVLYAQDNVIYDYIKEIKDKAVPVELSDEEFIKYKYNPKKLAFDIYGSTELYFIILAVNGMCSFKDFNKRNIKALHKSNVMDILEKIYNSESSYIEKNKKRAKKNADQV